MRPVLQSQRSGEAGLAMRPTERESDSSAFLSEPTLLTGSSGESWARNEKGRGCERPGRREKKEGSAVRRRQEILRERRARSPCREVFWGPQQAGGEALGEGRGAGQG